MTAAGVRELTLSTRCCPIFDGFGAQYLTFAPRGSELQFPTCSRRSPYKVGQLKSRPLGVKCNARYEATKIACAPSCANRSPVMSFDISSRYGR